MTTKYRFIGDTLLAVPAIRSMHERWPDADITLIAGRYAAEMMRGCPYLSDIIAFNPDSPANRGLGQYRKLVSQLRPRRYDLAFVYHTSFHSALTPFLSGVRYRVGWRGFEGRDFLFSRTFKYCEDRSEIDMNLDLVRYVAPDASGDRSLGLWLTDDERHSLPPELHRNGTIVGIQPGATNERKRWPADRYVELADELLRNGVEQIALLGGDDERDDAQEFMNRAARPVRERCIDLVGRLPLRQTLGVVSQLSAFISGDTAIRHCAVALDVASIGLFGPTNLVKWGNPVPPKHLVVASPTGTMDGIGVNSVAKATLGLIECASVGVRRAAAAPSPSF